MARSLRRSALPLMAAGPSLAASLRRRLLLGRRPFSGGAAAAPDASAAAPATVPGRKVLETFREEFEIGSRLISLETGKVARFANGSVVLAMGDTHVLSTVACAKGSDAARDFLPLTVDYQEKQYAQGMIPTTFMRREGAPKERELLCGRLIDRPIRPLFPSGFFHEVQVTVNVLSSDGKQDPDVMAANATSAALMLSDIPWNGPIGVIRVGRIDGKFVFNPTMDELSSSDLNLVYACTRDRTLMIDVQAREITERDLQTGLRLAHPEVLAVKYIEPQIRLAEKVGKRKKEYKLSLISDRSFEKIKNLSEARIEEVFTDSTYGKFERGEALDKITQTVKSNLEEECDEESLKFLPKAIDTVRKQIIRHRIIEKGLRVDGRQLDEVRPLYCESGTYPILHGSALFSRGDTQVLCTVTLGAPGDAQRLDSIVGPPTKRFMLHYSFPPFSINEVAKRGGLNRREVGHGTLAEKALLAVLPPENDFPYAVRVNSEVMASDGSTSMASVCGGSIALMDAGIPVREHVAGVSVGLVSKVDPATGDITDYRILTDILGLEDHLGDMDFKIAGTRKGITAIQLDIKPAGIPLDIICESLEPARTGRNQILDRMEQEISAARTLNDTNTPRLATLKFSNDSLRRLLVQRKRIEQEAGARISVSDGTVTIVAKTQSVMERALEKVEFLVGREIEVGRVYKGVVYSIKEYGAFVEFNGGQHGLLHISELSHEAVSKVSDVVSIGQELSLMCIGQDVRGNIKLSLKATRPQHEKKTSEGPDSNSTVPPKQQVNVWASVENAPADSDNLESSSGDDESEPNEEEPLKQSTPSIVIRSAAECDAQDIASGQTINKKSSKATKSSPRPYSNTDAGRSREVGVSAKSTSRKAVNSIERKMKKAEEAPKKGDLDGTTRSSTSSFRSGSLKLGDRVLAKVYQVRAHGLVLELSDGVRGMYKFEMNGRRDFEVEEEIHVECSSFSTKGIPVFSLVKE
ncbi:Polyribonucleotide nucleotidyltransferase 2, mitochondrial [Ananas comosus]|uniref:Polyribonucleotide nucleotidyltransferase 2, mitochondrial n=1 Tax=Ananas comosus TaxID=4615 RepID=A0A199VRN6_ANACO|nr:Polyribonucleotide nucleotidyltransferase 2, mitochondrial [Ananas comosus]